MFSKLKRILHPENMLFKMIILNCGLLLLVTLVLTAAGNYKMCIRDRNNMIGPIGMLLAGMVIADVPLKTVFTKKRNYVSTVLRLIIYPIFILILMKMINTFAGVNDSKQILLTVYIASITPVSYTHLDVYKRQVPASGSLTVTKTVRL